MRLLQGQRTLPPVSRGQRPATLAHPTPKKGDAPPTFENFNEELEYLRCKEARLEKQHKLKSLHCVVLSKMMHQRSKSLSTLVEPLPLKLPAHIDIMVRFAILIPLEFSSHKPKDFVTFIRKIETLLDLDEALYPTEKDQMLFATQYLVSDATTAWEHYCPKHPEAKHI